MVSSVAQNALRYESRDREHDGDHGQGGSVADHAAEPRDRERTGGARELLMSRHAPVQQASTASNHLHLQRSCTMTTNSQPRQAKRLAEMGTGDLVQVRHCPTNSSSGSEIPKIRTGEVLLCIDVSREDTLVARPDGSRLRIGRDLGMEIEVRPFWNPISSTDPDDFQNQLP
jgi:hypothetical protein